MNNTERELGLFEANNSLPFFWIALLDYHTLQNTIQVWKDYEIFEASHTEEVEDYLNNKSNNIIIDRQRFEENAARSRSFLQINFPTVIPLFDDFIQFIQLKFESDDKLEIDLIEITNFYDSFDEFWESIISEVKAIEENQAQSITFLFTYDLIASGTGFESIMTSNELSKLPAYQEAMKNRKPPVYSVKYTYNKESLFTAIAILVLCPVFSYLTYKMYEANDLVFMVVFTGISNIGFYIFSIWEIISQINIYIKRGK